LIQWQFWARVESLGISIDHFENMQGKTMTQLRKMPKDANGLPIFSPQSQ
jgi:hypothetical protein